jgi:predicted AAA+ superfamily ATPase
MYSNRLIDRYLDKWRDEPVRKPLLLRGARQIGKSTSVKEFGQKFDSFLEINFEETPEISNFFKGNLDVHKIIENLSVFYNKAIIPGKTLLFFDEVQSSPEALNSLRYFYEKMPDLHIIATGSLLEFALGELPTFGVGRIKSLFMYPMCFDEFLIAMNEEKLLALKQKASTKEPLNEPIHNKLNDYLFSFILIGGMPEAVIKYATTKSMLAVQDVLTDLYVAFQADFAKYKKRVSKQRITEVFDAIVKQAGGKFILSKVKNLNNLQVMEALQLLIHAGLVLPVKHSSGNGIPIGAEANDKKTKMHLFDTGLFQNVLGLNLSTLLPDIKNIVNKGVLAEQFWGLEYLKYQLPTIPPALYYWHRETPNANAEVDYLIQQENNIVPVEIKSSGQGSMQSMHRFIAEKNKAFGYRFSLENYSDYDKIKVMPLYAVSSLFNNLHKE